jgi:hypothetical protein
MKISQKLTDKHKLAFALGNLSKFHTTRRALWFSYLSSMAYAEFIGQVN